MRIYMHARDIMAKLYDDDDPNEKTEKERILGKYRPIEKTDLSAETTVLEAFTPGLRNKGSAWFWSLEDTDAAQSSHWMKDCE